MAKENGWTPPPDNSRAMNVDDETLEAASQLLAAFEQDLVMPLEVVEEVLESLPLPSPSPQRSSKRTKKEGKDQRTRNPSSGEITDVLLQEYKGNLLFSQPHGQFFMYAKE